MPLDPQRTALYILIGGLAVLLLSEIFFDAVSDPWGYDPVREQGWAR